MAFKHTELGTPAFWDLLQSNPELIAKEVCSIDLSDLETTLQQHPALRAWVNAAFETSKIQEERAKWELGKARAKALFEVKSENDPHSGKTKTVAVMDAEVELRPEVIEAMEDYFSIASRRAVLRAMADGLEDRLQMLIQIAAKHRQEMKDYS